MTPERNALETISELAARTVSGELICASDSAEVHVYFQRGRIAWATDSTRPLAFTRHLLETAQIDVEIFREILESCRREKRPLGETLIAWGVATREEVLLALRHQIQMALALVRDAQPMQTLFLNRSSQFSDYDAELTFSVDELLVARVSAPSAPPRRPAAAVRAPRDPSAESSAAMRLRASVDGVAWVETLDGTTLVEAVPEPQPTTRLPARLVEQTLLDGAELVALRMSKTTIGGVALGGTGSLWCLATNGVTVGAIVTALESLATESLERRVPSTAGAVHGEAADRSCWSTGDGEPPAMRALTEFVERAPELHAAFVTTQSGAPYGVGRSTTRPEELASLIARRASALADRDVFDESAHADVDADGLSSRRTMCAESDVCLFAAEIVTEGRSRFVWLVLARSCSKGLGWGYLTSLGRQIVRAFRGEPPSG